MQRIVEDMLKRLVFITV